MPARTNKRITVDRNLTSLISTGLQPDDLTLFQARAKRWTLRVTPALQAGITDHIWDVRELLEGLESSLETEFSASTSLFGPEKSGRFCCTIQFIDGARTDV
jgi:hypothetical protein